MVCKCVYLYQYKTRENLIILGIHTANAVQQARRIAKAELHQAV